jgi:hypothetical protein
MSSTETPVKFDYKNIIRDTNLLREHIEKGTNVNQGRGL